MPCAHIKLPGGGHAIVRYSGARQKKCKVCKHAAPYLCDWKVGKAKTCDKPICGQHAKEVAPDKHLCPEHQVAYDAWLGKHTA